MDGQKRKKWTPVEDPDDAVLRLREKRKWQIALRRYVIEQNKCLHYAPYFGLDIKNFRAWIENQFNNDLTWVNFSEKWQLDHVVAVNYFDFTLEEDLRLCWHFTNIRVSPVSQELHRSDLLVAKSYFQALFDQTSLPVCGGMVRKINNLEIENKLQVQGSAHFISDRREIIQQLSGFSIHELEQVNQGVEINEILAERDLLKNFG